MGKGIEEEFVKDNICMPSTPPKGLVRGISRILPDGDLAPQEFKLSVDIFDEVGSTPKKSEKQTRERDHIEIGEKPQSDALGVKGVSGEEASSKDDSYNIQTQRNLRIVVVGLSSPALAPSSGFSQNVKKRRNSATTLKQNPRKRHNCTDKPQQKPKLEKSKPEILNDEDNTKCTPNTQVSESYFKPKTPKMSCTRKARTKRTYIRKNCSKLVTDSSVATNEPWKQALDFDLENTAGDGCHLFEDKAEILNDEGNTKCTPNTQVSKPFSKQKTPAMSSTRKARTNRTCIRKNYSKHVADPSNNIQSVAVTKPCKGALDFELENTAGDGCNLFGIRPEILKCTPNTQVSESYFKPKTPAITSTCKARRKRTCIRKIYSKLVADSLNNNQHVAASKPSNRASDFDLENTAGDGCNLFENDVNQAANLELVEKVEKRCSLSVLRKIIKRDQSLKNRSKKKVLNFQKMYKKRRLKRLVHILGFSCRTVETSVLGKRSTKGMDLNTKLDCTSEESQAALETPDMYSAIKMRKRRLAKSTQRPVINVTSFPKEDQSQLEKELTKNHDAKFGERVGLATKEKGNKKRWKKLLSYDENVGSSNNPQKEHKFRAKVDLDEESERVYNLLTSNGGNIYDQEAETDSEKKEYWDSERTLTRIRVESFISTIGMIQGDRSFSPWKGSVVDSVVGAFLTQNVCDHFSSSAFVSLSARFPNQKLNGMNKNLQPESNDLCPSGGETDPSSRKGLEFASHLPSYIKRECKDEQKKETSIESDNLRKKHDTGRASDEKTMDIVDWEAVRQATVEEVAETIKRRGMNNVIAGKIKDFLNKIVEDHGSPDLEWLRDVPPEEAKNYLLNIYGIGEKSVECIRLLTLHHVAFPVDTNVRRVAVRLGWVPLKPLPGGLHMHLLEMYPVVNSIQKYLYPRLCTLNQEKLYLLHYHLITFGKVFCTKKKPNCNACPMRGECKYFASAFASHRLALPAPGSKDIVTVPNLVVETTPLVMEIDPEVSDSEYRHMKFEAGSERHRPNCEPIIEHPSSPVPAELQDIEDLYKDSDELNGLGNYDDDDIPIIRIDNKACMEYIKEFATRYSISLEGDMSKILSLLNSPAPLPMPALKHVGRLRTVHQVYELPDDHPILDEVDRRDPDDPSPYLFTVWNEGKHRSSISHTSSSGKQVRYKIVCNCSGPDCESLVCGTLLIPVRSANHGTFPLNGTYFQVNEVFADDESTQRPIVAPRDWLWGLTRKNLYCGTSPTTTFKGFDLYHIQHALCKGFFCNRGFNRKTRDITPLGNRFHINTMQKKKKASAMNSNTHAL